jgi:hypothetical protein
MCNPRRVTITLTRELAEAWRREVSRSVQLRGRVAGEARVRQALGATLGVAARRALHAALEGQVDGWQEVEGGYRHDVEGGYLVYRPDEQALEIVATQEDEVAVEGTASETLTGEVGGTLTVEGQGTYFDDEYGGRTRQDAEQDAAAAAQRNLETETRRRLDQEQQAAEQAADVGLRQRAEAAGQQALRDATARRQAELERRAAERLEAVGHRCRQAFHQVLARAYRDAILAYARRQGAEVVHDREDDGVLEIEFRLRE